MKVRREGGVWSYQDNGCAVRGVRNSRLWPHRWAVASAGAGRSPGPVLSPRAAQTDGSAVSPPLTGCVTSGKLLSLCELQVSQL